MDPRRNLPLPSHNNNEQKQYYDNISQRNNQIDFQKNLHNSYEQSQYYDSSLKLFIPPDMYNSLNHFNNSLSIMNEDLSNRIKRCEELRFGDFESLKKQITLDTESLVKMTEEMRRKEEELDVYAIWDNDDMSFGSPLSKEGSLIKKDGYGEEDIIRDRDSLSEKSFLKKISPKTVDSTKKTERM